MVYPPFDLLASGPDWLRYYRFFNRFTRWPGSLRFAETMRVYNEGFVDVRAIVMSHLSHLPDELRRLRWSMAANQLVDAVTRLADTPNPTPTQIADQARCLVDMTTAGLAAACSD